LEQQGLALPERFDLPTHSQVEDQLRAIDDFRKLVHANLIQDTDFGTIPGTPKPTLLKPGAEKIVKLLRCADTYEIIEEIKDFDKPLFSFMVRCRLIWMATGEIVSEGLGECNSYEAKYRWRQKQRSCPTCNAEAIIVSKIEGSRGDFYCFPRKGGCGANYHADDPAITDQKSGRVENDDIFSQVNTLLKMAKKRALVDAALSAGRLSDIFTQDLDELPRDQVTAERGASKEDRRPRPNGDAQARPRTNGNGSQTPEGEAPITEGGTPTFANRGALFNAVKTQFNKTPADLCDLRNISDPAKIEDFGATWMAACEAWGKVDG
jgi:hypothetical protein